MSTTRVPQGGTKGEDEDEDEDEVLVARFSIGRARFALVWSYPQLTEYDKIR